MKAVLAKLVPQNFNDFLCLYALSLFVALWIIQGLGVIQLRDDVNGALTVLATLIIQYYFRKSPNG